MENAGESAMNLNAAIIDLRLGGVQDQIRAWAADELKLNVAAPTGLQSLTFVYLSVQTLLDLDALSDLYGEKAISTLQLSATFRRADTIQRLLMLTA
jgi:hypothetical protein